MGAAYTECDDAERRSGRVRSRRRRLIGLAAATAACLAAIGLGLWGETDYIAVRLAVSGTPEQIGRGVGKQFAPIIRSFHPTFLMLAQAARHQSKASLYRRAAALAQKLAPEDLAEIKGLAAAAEMPFEDALFLNLFYALVHDSAYCRQIAVWGARTRDGELIHGRNLDWRDYPGSPLKKHNLILDVKPDKGIEYVMLTWPGLQCVLTGTNRKGVTVGFNQLRYLDGAERVAEPIFFTLKRILRTCESAEQAAQVITETKPLGNGSVLISDASRRTAIVVEVIGERVAVRRGLDDMIGNANHPAIDAWGRVDQTAAERPACEVAREIDGRLDVDEVRDILADRRVLMHINLLSVIFVPARNRMHLACGRSRPAQGEFVEYVLFSEHPGQVRGPGHSGASLIAAAGAP